MYLIESMPLLCSFKVKLWDPQPFVNVCILIKWEKTFLNRTVDGLKIAQRNAFANIYKNAFLKNGKISLVLLL